MARIEKTVFISYRRANIGWALAVFQNLTHHGYDVFFDYSGITSGAFEKVILENIRARAHFLVLLTPTALDRCGNSKDWLRREIEEAIGCQRNIVPLMLERFSFDEPGVVRQLKGKLKALREYNGLEVPGQFFPQAMTVLRDQYLNVGLSSVLHPASDIAVQSAAEQINAASSAIEERAAEHGDEAESWLQRVLAASNVELPSLRRQVTILLMADPTNPKLLEAKLYLDDIIPVTADSHTVGPISESVGRVSTSWQLRFALTIFAIIISSGSLLYMIQRSGQVRTDAVGQILQVINGHGDERWPTF
jgi:hypothetical protein